MDIFSYRYIYVDNLFWIENENASIILFEKVEIDNFEISEVSSFK